MARYDSIIIGTGPAGLEAALNLKIRGKRFLLIGNENLSDKTNLAPRIENYLGLPSIAGSDLSERFKEHLAKMDILITPEKVTTVYPMGDYFALATSHNTYEATTVIVATGISAAKPYKGEQEFLGKGVGYCATCDAALYKGKTVAIIGNSKDAVTEANFIAEVAEKVYFVSVGKQKALPIDSVEIIEGKIVEIKGEAKATSLVLSTGEIIADGIFVLRDVVAPSSLVMGLEVKDGYIVINNNMETNISGCFAAGDCTGTPHQYIKAAGQGLVAAFNAVKYIDER